MNGFEWALVAFMIPLLIIALCLALISREGKP